MVPGDGGAEEDGVKVNLFWQKNPVGSKRGGAGTFMFAKKVHQKNIQISIIIYFQSPSVIYCLDFR